MQALYSGALIKLDDMESQLTEAFKDLTLAQNELENSKKQLQDTSNGSIVTFKEEEMKVCNQQEIKHLKKKHSPEKWDEVKRERDHLKKEVNELSVQNEILIDERKAKEKEAELNTAERNKLENEVWQLRSVTGSLQTEVSEMKQQLTIALADKETLSDESLAKTQQVKQYKKQCDNWRIQMHESNARIEQFQARLHQCESDLAYCQRDLQSREEDEESRVRYLIASHPRIPE